MAKLNDVLKGLRKKNSSGVASSSNIVGVDEYYDTGSLALNRVCSGELNKGIPRGRIVTLFGASGSGKSLIAAQTVATALKNNKVDRVFWVDSEGGGTGILQSFGVDLDLVEYVPVLDVEDCCVKMVNIYEELVKARKEYEDNPEDNDEIRAIVVLDSFGGLASNKLINDATKKDQMVADMGNSAKMRNAMIKTLMMRVVVSKCTLIVINHEYQNPGALFASKIHSMAGGLGIEYASHIILQTTKLLVKSGDNDYLTGNENSETTSAFYKGNRLNFFCTKNRVCKPGFSANVYVDFSSGISKYDGLIDDAVSYGFLEEVRGGYICKSFNPTKRITYRELVSSDEIWNTFITDFNKKSIEMMSYSSPNALSEEDEKKLV